MAVDCVLSSKEVWKHFSLVRNIFHPWQLCPLHQTEHLSWISSFRLPADVFLYASQSLVCSAESLDVSGQTASGNIFSAAVRTEHRGSWNIWQTFRYSSSLLLFTVGWSGHFLLNASNWMMSGRWRGSMGSAVPGSAGAFESRADVDGWQLEEVKAHVQLTPDTSGFLLIHSSITTSVLHHVQRDGHWRADTSEENIFKYIQILFCYCSCPRLYITLFHTLAASPKWRRADCHPISLHAVTLVMIRIKQRVVRRSGWSSLTNRSHIISVGHVTYKVNSYSYLLRLLVATWCLFWLNFSISVSAEQNPLGPG